MEEVPVVKHMNMGNWESKESGYSGKVSQEIRKFWGGGGKDDSYVCA